MIEDGAVYIGRMNHAWLWYGNIFHPFCQHMKTLHILSNLSTYLILYKYGGVYADTDISFHSNATIFEQLLPHGVGLVESPFRYNER